MTRRRPAPPSHLRRCVSPHSRKNPHSLQHSGFPFSRHIGSNESFSTPRAMARLSRICGERTQPLLWTATCPDARRTIPSAARRHAFRVRGKVPSPSADTIHRLPPAADRARETTGTQASTMQTPVIPRSRRRGNRHARQNRLQKRSGCAMRSARMRKCRSPARHRLRE